MAHATQKTFTAHLADLASDKFTDLSERWSRYTVYRRTLAELKQLSTREMADLGMNPSTLKSIAYEAAYKN